MYTINSLSGGKTSSYLAVHYPADVNLFSVVCIDDERCRVKDRKLVQYINEKLETSGMIKYGEFIATAEDDQVLRVMVDLEQRLGSPIEWVRHHSFEWWIKKKGGMLSNQKMRYCTTSMKIQPIAEYVIAHILPLYDMQPVFMNIGLRADEQRRAKVLRNREYRTKIITHQEASGRNRWKEYFWAVANYPLIYDCVDHYDVHEYWRGKDIVFPDDSNCVGCFWKHVQKLRKNWDRNPEKMQWFADMEQQHGHFWKPNINYETIKTIGLQQELPLGMGAGCMAGFCTD